ncbi:MAG: response regulator [Geopsychrobacter sp.]|nr:response regulator [Geopsychrobacter sp.]
MNREGFVKQPILIIDDDLFIRELLQRILCDEGFDCDVAASAEEALELLEQKNYGLAISDIRMPEMDGLEFLDCVQQRWPELQVVIGSGLDDRDTALEALRRGAVGYMLKPFEPVEVLVHASNALWLRQLEIAHRKRCLSLEQEVESCNQELKCRHRKMVEQEKLASLGQLSAGVAHEVNNPTGYIASNLSTLKKYLNRLEEYLRVQESLITENCSGEGLQKIKTLRKRLKVDNALEDAVEIIADSLEGTERIRRIVMGLKNFSRKESEEMQPVDINQILDETLALCWNELTYKADVVREFADLPLISGLPQKLSQVFLNLLVNAAQAIEGRGTIRVQTRKIHNIIEVLISDTGSGISDENLEKIFEPFFTTKEAGVGTGLGLAILKEILALHKGEIWVESQVGKGTTFGVRLPVA